MLKKGCSNWKVGFFQSLIFVFVGRLDYSWCVFVVGDFGVGGVNWI